MNPYPTPGLKDSANNMVAYQYLEINKIYFIKEVGIYFSFINFLKKLRYAFLSLLTKRSRHSEVIGKKNKLLLSQSICKDSLSLRSDIILACS